MKKKKTALAIPPAVSSTRHSRARDRAISSPREGRVREAMALMAAGTFVVGKSARELAAKWGTTLSVAWDATSEAWRRHGAEVTDPHRVKVKLAETLEAVIDEALVETREPALIDGGGERGVYQESPNGARRVVVEAAKTLSALIGTGEGATPPDWYSRSVEERRAFLDRAQARVDTLRAELPPTEEEP